jgi:hypothetical protein
MADITTRNEITQAGLTFLSYSAASSGGDEYENNGRFFVVIKNSGEVSCTVTFTAQVTSFHSPQYGTSSIANATLAVASGRSGFIGPFPVSTFNDTNGYVQMTYSATSDVTVAICSL